MIFQHANHKKHMMIHNLQTLFCVLVAIVHKRYFENIMICGEIAR